MNASFVKKSFTYHSLFTSLFVFKYYLTFPCRYPINEHRVDFIDNLGVDFERDICVGDSNTDEDVDNYFLPPDLLRLVEQEEKRILPNEGMTEIVNLGSEEKKKEVKVGTSITTSIKLELTKLLQEYADVFAWSYQDMPGLSTDIVVHKLPTKPECRPIQQKLRRMRPDMLLKIKEEVKSSLTRVS